MEYKRKKRVRIKNNQTKDKTLKEIVDCTNHLDRYVYGSEDKMLP